MTMQTINQQGKLYQILVKPLLTEKSSLIMEKNNIYTFEVQKDANKHEIKNAIEKLFDVTVTKIQTLNVKPKQKTFRGNIGYRKSYKKAYVTLKEGDSIKLFSNE